ncbi:protogenin B-like isoform X2 [Oratosquilla oratoria]|uniref:protogenin B-like isoform X2 n=1 Tax=Oratosquilla oratoria TaxID=337810 RepID=UPI003F7630DC
MINYVPMAHAWMLWCVWVAVLALPQSRANGFLQDSRATRGLDFGVLPPDTVVAKEGSRVLVPCQPSKTANGRTSVTWTHRGKVVNERYVLDNSSLLIEKVQPSMAGVYQCILTTLDGSIVAPPTHIVMARIGPWKLNPGSYSIIEGASLRLKCEVASSPPAEYRWLKDQNPLPQSGRFYYPVPGVLHMVNASVQDAGTYSCRAYNPVLGETIDSDPGSLTVTPPEASSSTSSSSSSSSSSPALVPAPSIEPIPSQVEVALGKRAVLECLATASFGTRLTWSRIDMRPIREEGVSREGQGSLVFDSVQASDNGVYKCSLSGSALKRPIMKMIDLSVQQRPVIVYGPIPQMERTGKSAVRFNCTAYGKPEPEIRWYANSFLLPMNGRHHVLPQNVTHQNFMNGTTSVQLAIGNIMGRDSGIYQCMAINSVGVASEAAILQVEIPSNTPGAPTELTVVNLNATSVLVSWKPAEDSEMGTLQRGYTVHYMPLNSESLETQTITNQTTIVITGLRPDTNYSIYVRAFVINNNASSANSNFGEPSPTKTWRTLSLGLLPRKRYNVRVVVEKEKTPLDKVKLPWDPIKMPSRTDMQDVLKTIVRLTVIQNTHIKVKWSLNGKTPENIVGYRVSYNSSDRVHETVVVGKHQRSYQFDTSERGVCYTVHVIPMSTNRSLVRGVGANTTLEELYRGQRAICTIPIVLTPSSDLSIRKLEVVVINSTSLKVRWQPMQRKMVPDFYTVRYVNLGRPVDEEIEKNLVTPSKRSARSAEDFVGIEEEAEIELEEVSSPHREKRTSRIHQNLSPQYIRVTRNRLRLTGLEPMTLYEVSVSADTLELTGTFSSAIRSITPEGVPTAPKIVNWTALSPSRVRISWYPPERINGNLRSYRISYSQDGIRWDNITKEITDTETELYGLVSNKNYTVQLRGITGGGEGEAAVDYIFIQAVLVTDSFIELLVKCLVPVLACITCGIIVVFSIRMFRLRNAEGPSVQGNGTCRVAYANGFKRRPHTTATSAAAATAATATGEMSENDVHLPMLTSIPPATPNHHLDTKGGPGIRVEGTNNGYLALGQTCSPHFDQVVTTQISHEDFQEDNEEDYSVASNQDLRPTMQEKVGKGSTRADSSTATSSVSSGGDKPGLKDPTLVSSPTGGGDIPLTLIMVLQEQGHQGEVKSPAMVPHSLATPS